MEQGALKAMRVMVTGAGGFIGGALAAGLQRTGRCDLVAQSRSAAPAGLPAGISWLQCDLLKGIPLDDTVDYIVHCAALQDYSRMPVKDFIDCNRAMTEQVAAYASKVGAKGIIFASSISLHGQISTRLVDEHTEVVNPSPYGVSKQVCERALSAQSADIPAVALRLCGVVGTGAKDIWLSRVLRSARCGEPVEIHNAESLFNNLLHTDDLVVFVQNLMRSGFTGFSAFPLASRLPMTIRDVAAQIISSCGSFSEIVDKGSAGDPYLISNEYAVSRFGYVPSDVMTNLIKFARSG